MATIFVEQGSSPKFVCMTRNVKKDNTTYRYDFFTTSNEADNYMKSINPQMTMTGFKNHKLLEEWKIPSRLDGLFVGAGYINLGCRDSNITQMYTNESDVYEYVNIISFYVNTVNMSGRKSTSLIKCGMKFYDTLENATKNLENDEKNILVIDYSDYDDTGTFISKTKKLWFQASKIYFIDP